jgi:hypothetical protein
MTDEKKTLLSERLAFHIAQVHDCIPPADLESLVRSLLLLKNIESEEKRAEAGDDE